MINEALYNKTVDILFKAYQDNTIEHGNCYSCAVGNIVAANMGFEYEVTPNVKRCSLHWKGRTNVYHSTAEYTNTWIDGFECGEIWEERITGHVEEQIKATGYNPKQIQDIEHAFESAAWFDKNTRRRIYNGLVNVLNVLNDIHEVPPKVRTKTKERFKQHYQSLTA